MSDKNQAYDPTQQDEVLDDMFEDYFLEYASYVILERAVPASEDGLKPVQRRLMHALKEMDDGRFNKVANVIGATMQFHPHGDASIGDAMVTIGQKELLLDIQGNWGDVRTGDSAAAPRYIEVRLSKFANEVLFNEDTTEWQMSYDGRKREPVTLPAKFPLLLEMGVEGIAVGLSTKLMPHNFIEICEASIKHLKGQKFAIYPDFLTGGILDVSAYNDGARGGKIKARARISEVDKKTLKISEIPYGTTTGGLIDSIIKANERGKIKVKKVEDNTARDVEIIIHLGTNTSPDITIDALYAFTSCEVSISPNAVVVRDDKPHFVSVSDILRDSTDQTLHLLKRELEIKKFELMEKLLYSSLEKIFIENRIYRDIEECETFEAVIDSIDQGLEPYKKDFYREIGREDILRLTEIRIKRISKFDAFKADELMTRLLESLKEVNHHLDNLTDYAIDFFNNLIKKYGEGRERRTELLEFQEVKATVVAANNQKLYVDRQNGFIGYGIKKEEFLMDCSDIDDIIAFKRDGTYSISKVSDKNFVGKDIIHCSVWRKNDERRIYNAIYLDAKSGKTYAKRFNITSITRDKEYNVTKGAPKSKVLYFSDNENGEAEIVTVSLTASSTAKKKQFDYNFADLLIKGRSSMGNMVTKYPVRKVALKSAGKSTLGGVDIWYTPNLGRLNRDEHGDYIGNFEAEDKVLVLYKTGEYELTNFELTNHYDARSVMLITKLEEEGIISAIYYDGESRIYYIKRFQIETTTMDKKFAFLTEHNRTELLGISYDDLPRAELKVKKDRKSNIEKIEFKLEELVGVKGWKAIGNKLPFMKISEVKMLEPEIIEKEEPEENEDDNDDNNSSESGKAPSVENTADNNSDESKEKPKPEETPKAEGPKPEQKKDKPKDPDSENQISLF
ncbi:DNA gyrase/topoisomerase IV subunit A [Arcticibacterium luteifluviistationis]|uniref:DNA gyrase/topoisomerase IV subunit A n=1 Tax=Arcticibacterium luteifluviistationis TaxID=1784714 RepID=A0A2Z4GHB6_9BACT|nr:DNA gyrase/topoisomerase IV subunit A [Arcticibacterium luteifluviistationis]AWW00468.1 DNA gyrase/topoisomerase IV subunit A [Arcticibacterium luteifluviistationis]